MYAGRGGHFDPCVKRFAGKIPLLGVCLGHQSIGQAFGGKIVRAGRLMHGKTDMIQHDGQGLYEGIPNPFEATRYHSLVIQPDTLSDQFTMTAWSNAPDGELRSWASSIRPCRSTACSIIPRVF